MDHFIVLKLALYTGLILFMLNKVFCLRNPKTFQMSKQINTFQQVCFTLAVLSPEYIESRSRVYFDTFQIAVRSVT